MKITITENDTYRELCVKELEKTDEVQEINLIMQTLEMLDDFRKENFGAMPGTITDLVEWNSTPQEEENLPFS